MVILDRLPTKTLVILALILWLAYFTVCAEPSGVPFVYADF